MLGTLGAVLLIVCEVWQLIDLLYTVVHSGATRARVSGQTVYGKTGTNSEMRGVFFAGFTGYYRCV